MASQLKRLTRWNSICRLPSPGSASSAALVQPAETLRPVLCRSLHASTTRSLIDASAFFSRGNPTLVGVLRHELGHTLGMGHSSEDPSEPNSLLRDALMYYRIHSDGRGGSGSDVK